MWIATVKVDGVAVSLDQWLARGTIRHGRGAIYDEPTASTCNLVLLDPPRSFVHDLGVGADLAIDWTDEASTPHIHPRFRGRITDLSLADPELSVIATGRLASLKRESVSTAGWTPLPWSAAVARLLDACEVGAYRVTPPAGWDPVVEPPPEAEIAVNGYLAELGNAVGAAIYDDPDGTIVVEAIGAREAPGRVVLPLDAANVRYSPTWVQDMTITNRVTVIYGPNRETSATESDAESVGRYGPRRLEITTTLSSEADARKRAADRLGRSAWPRWQLQPIQMIRATIAPFTIGHRVSVAPLPPTAPYSSYRPVLEGWVDVIDRSSWSMELWCSDPLASGFLARWIDAGDTTKWVDLAPTLQWQDVVSPDQIGGVTSA